jgi:putative peptidoglycan lipid II flippase
MSANQKPSRSLAGIASIVAVATLISKIFGLVREQAIAAAFGVGPVVNAYAYAYIIPGFLLILLGGINGPFHSALVSVLAKRDKEEAPVLVETVTTLVSLILLIIAVILVIFAGRFIDLLAPGLDSTERSLAILQLQIMAPLAVLAGLVGIGFGALNASDQYWLPSISPLFSSLAVILGVGVLIWHLGDEINAPGYFVLGSIVLAIANLVGAILQWVAQLIAQWRSGMGTLKLRFNWQIPGVKEVMKVMIPATFSSGMLHINVYTDMFFASFIPNAAAAMRYANFIVLTPVGIISNVILVPFLPIFSRLTAPEDWPDLKLRIRQGLILTALTMLPLSAIFIFLALPIVKIIYERYAFAEDASLIVAPVLMAYGLGMFFYLARDVLVRVFYALGDGQTPFRISIGNIFLNAILDYILVEAFAIPGLVFATIGVNIVSMIIMLIILNHRLKGLPLGEWGMILVGLSLVSAIARLASWGTDFGLGQLMGNNNIWLQLIQLTLATIIGLIVFFLLAIQLKLPELNLLVSRLRQKFRKKS